MKLYTFWTVWYLALLSLVGGMDLSSCNCKQCRHVSEIRDRCECCVFLLHGKRSSSIGNGAPKRNDSPSENPSTRPKRKNSSYILDILNPFGIQGKSSGPEKYSNSHLMSLDTVNIPRHLYALMILKNRPRALDTSSTDHDIFDFESKIRYKTPFGYRLKAMEPFYFQYDPIAENKNQAGDGTAIRNLKRFLTDYDFENGVEYTGDFLDADDVVDVVESRGDSNELY